MALQSRNFFVSYHHDYDQGYVKKLHQIKQGMKVADYSLKEDISEYTDEQIYNVIRNKMRACSVTIILIGERTGHRKWIDWELWASLRAYKNSRNPKRSFKPKGLMRWKNIERDLESKINYAIWKRDNTSHQIKNNLKRFDRNAFNFLGLKI